ncbi:MAG: hypothetical protein NTW17_01285 [Candidatus Pacearchaeota archaeon]|nr:hypothetical protein [Candidatus Pacearchaeota archaeon]
MVKILEDITPTGIASAYVEAPFDEGKEALESRGYNVISLEDNARLRIQQGKDAFVSRNGNWVREGVLYVPKKGIFLTKNSPIMLNPKEATNAHRKGKDYFLTGEQVEQSLVDSIELSGEAIPTNRFGENPTTAYAFGEIAEQYGNFLKEAKINKISIWLADLQDKPFARQMWFRDLGGGSGLDGDGRDLGIDGRLRGVKIGAEGTASNFVGYTEKQISEVLKRLKLQGLEGQILSGLRQ